MNPNELCEGTISWFGGPFDFPDKHGRGGVKWDEGLALYNLNEADGFPELFMSAQDCYNTTPLEHRGDISRLGLARRLIPNSLYCACRWDYKVTPLDFLRESLVECWPISRPERRVSMRPVDWGPNESTGRKIDVSFGALQKMAITTNDMVAFKLIPMDIKAWSISG